MHGLCKGPKLLLLSAVEPLASIKYQVSQLLVQKCLMRDVSLEHFYFALSPSIMLPTSSSTRLLCYQDRIRFCRASCFFSSSPVRTHYAPLSTLHSSFGKTESLVLDNGHTLSYSVCGSTKSSATPVLYFHGFPSSRLELVGSWPTPPTVR